MKNLCFCKHYLKKNQIFDEFILIFQELNESMLVVHSNMTNWLMITQLIYEFDNRKNYMWSRVTFINKLMCPG